MSVSCAWTAGEASSASAPPRVGGKEDELANAVRVIQSERLGDEPAHRPSEHACTLEVERLDHLRRVVRQLGDIERPSVVSGCTDAAVVEEEELVGGGEAVDKQRIPVGARRR